VASERVLKNLAAHSHLSMRTEVIRPFSYKKPGCAFALHRNYPAPMRRDQAAQRRQRRRRANDRRAESRQSARLQSLPGRG
jgi:hypothetical protein